MPTATTIGGWAVILALAGTFYFVNNQRKNKHRRAVEVKPSTRAVETKKDQKAKKVRKDGGQSSGDQAVKPSQKPQKKKAQSQNKPAVEEAVTTALESKDTSRQENDNDAREFARLMSNAKSGTLSAPKSQGASRPKSVKQGRAQDKPVVESSDNATAPSSTTGGDADDDESPLNSPDFGATNAKEPTASGDVSDMLEPATGGPSILRLTESTKTSAPKKQKPQAIFEPAETKKQRQNRKKAEEKKAAREAEEKERQVLLEKQRRTAREAEGRAAKDGSAFMASQAPSKSVWTAPPEVNGSNGTNGAPAKPVELLDTYEPNVKVTTKPAEKVYSESEEAGSQLAKDYAHMTEDEQIRFAVEDSAAWQTVKTKEKRKKKAGGKSSDGSKDSASEKDEYGVPPVSAPTVPGKKWSQDQVFVKEGEVVEQRKEDIEDSEWEVA
jgi:hypothetical protein